MQTQQPQRIAQLKWTNGTVCERSPRPNYGHTNQTYTQTKTKDFTELEQQLDAIRENSAYMQSLHYDSTPIWLTNEYLNENTTQNKSNNKREESFNKIVEREMMGQIGRNPFLDNDYIADVQNSSKYLKPVATHLDKVEEEPPPPQPN